MNEIAISASIIAVEFFVLACVTLFVLMRKQARMLGTTVAQEKADAKAVDTLQEDVESAQDNRRAALATIFESTYNMEGEERDQAIEEFVERETAFYNAMASVYLDRNAERLQEIPAELTKVIAPWLRMTPKNVVPATQMHNLEESKAALEAELSESQQNLESLMREYQAAFDKHNTGQTDSVDEEAEETELEFESEQENPESVAEVPEPPADSDSEDALPEDDADELEELEELDTDLPELGGVDTAAESEPESPPEDAEAAVSAGEAEAGDESQAAAATESASTEQEVDDEPPSASEQSAPPSDDDIEALLAAAGDDFPAESTGKSSTDQGFDIDLEDAVSEDASAEQLEEEPA